MSEKKQNDNTVNMWQEILREAMSKKELQDTNIFIFGDKLTGKKSLIRVLAKELNSKLEEHKKILPIDEEASSYGILDYTYLSVIKLNEKDNDEIGKMGVWIINELMDVETFKSLIKPKFILKCMCIIVVDLSRPWTIMNSINKWTTFIYDAFSALLLQFPFEKQQELRDKVVEMLKLYEEPKFDEDGNFLKEILTEEQKQIKLDLPLKEGILKTNCAIPIAIVVNKTDILNQTIYRKYYDEKGDFIFKHIRNIALSYGASIIYSSGKTSTNLYVLYDYFCHILFGFDLIHKPNLIEKESYFIPAGYDSLANLKSSDTLKALESLYDEVIIPEKEKEIAKEEEVICEDTNAFLAHLKKLKDARGVQQKRTRPPNPMAQKEEINNRTSNPFMEKFGGKGDAEKKDEMKKELAIRQKKLAFEDNTTINSSRQVPASTSTVEKAQKGAMKGKQDGEKFNKTKEEMMKKLGILRGKKSKKKDNN